MICQRLSILRAAHGGFIVTEDRPADGFTNQPLFAGSLDAALGYLRRHFGTDPHTGARSIDTMDLSVRTANCLLNAGIKTVDDLTKVTATELLRGPNFGRKSLNEIAEVLAGMGLSLATPHHTI